MKSCGHSDEYVHILGMLVYDLHGTLTCLRKGGRCSSGVEHGTDGTNNGTTDANSVAY
jgi:hypothetical protein